MHEKSGLHLTRGLLGTVLVMFLLPFLTLTCQGSKLITMSGMDLVTGTTIEAKDPFTGRSKTPERTKPEPLAGLAVVAAVAALGLSFMAGRTGRTFAGIGAIVSALALLAMKLKVEDNLAERGKGMFALQWEVGFWLSLLVGIAAAVVAFLPKFATDRVAGQACPACKAEQEPDSIYCDACGQKLR